MRTPALFQRTVHGFGAAFLLAVSLILMPQVTNAQWVTETVDKMDDDSQLSLTVDPKEMLVISCVNGNCQ